MRHRERCVVEACSSRQVRAELCTRHYRLVHGVAPFPKAPLPRCAEDECTNVAKVGDVCLRHWTQQNRLPFADRSTATAPPKDSSHLNWAAMSDALSRTAPLSDPHAFTRGEILAARYPNKELDHAS